MIDLHLHLDGSLSKEEIAHLAKMNHIFYDPDMVRLSVDETCKSLNDYLECFEFPLSLLQNKQSLEYASYALYKRLCRQGLIYAEVRFAPQLSTREGLSQTQVVQSVIKGYEKAHKEFGIEGQLILCCMRGDNNHEENIETIKVAKAFLHKGVCAVDLAGAEALFKTNTFDQEFALCREYKIPFTIHAGEADGSESVWDAIHFGASRIGHGVHSIEDPKLVEYLAEHRIPLEICPTSEVDTHCVPNIEGLRLRDFMDAGVILTINTDDMTVSNVTLQSEYDKIAETYGFDDEEIVSFMLNGIEASFLDEEGKKRLRAKLEERL